MITVYAWSYPYDGPWGPITMHEMVCPDTPQINANAPGGIDECKGFILASWNRHFPSDLKTADDFEYVAPPSDWVNPNQ